VDRDGDVGREVGDFGKRGGSEMGVGEGWRGVRWGMLSRTECREEVHWLLIGYLVGRRFNSLYILYIIRREINETYLRCQCRYWWCWRR